MKKALTLFVLTFALTLTATADPATESQVPAVDAATPEAVPPVEAAQPSIEEMLRQNVSNSHCNGLVVDATSQRDCFWACREYSCVPDYFEASTNCCFCKPPKTLSY